MNISIKNAPDDVVNRLKARAARHHRSLQGEVLAILEAAIRNDEPLTVDEALVELERIGLRTPSESVAMIREDRDGR